MENKFIIFCNKIRVYEKLNLSKCDDLGRVITAFL